MHQEFDVNLFSDSAMFTVFLNADLCAIVEDQMESDVKSYLLFVSRAGPVPYDPGVNLHEPVLLNEENEATLLRTQVIHHLMGPCYLELR